MPFARGGTDRGLRVPRLAHRRVMLFFWPTRASVASSQAQAACRRACHPPMMVGARLDNMCVICGTLVHGPTWPMRWRYWNSLII